MKKSLLLLFYFISLVNILSAQTVTGRIVNQNGDGLTGLQLQLYITPKVFATNSGADGTFTFNNITGVWNEQLPPGYTISDNYPNPFYPKTRINITLPKAGKVRIDIYNLLGQKVVDGQFQYLNAGENSIDLEFNGLMNGYYITRITIDDKYTVSRKMMLFDESLRLPTGVQTVLINKSASFVKSTQETKIDSLVVTGSSIGKKVFRSLPNISGNFLDLGNLTITGTKNLLDGALFFNGTVPDLGLVSYMDGTKLVTVTAYSGQVVVFFNTHIIETTAIAIITANRGTILGKVPNIGYYFVGVPIGQEGTFINSMRLNQSVYIALPHIAAYYMSSGITVIDQCGGSHGALVTGVIFDETKTVANCMNDDDGSGKPFLEKTMEHIVRTAVDADGGNAIINISSFGGQNNTDYNTQDSTTKASLETSCKDFLIYILTVLEVLDDNWKENLVITLCAGNDNVPMTAILAEIRSDPMLANVLKNNVLIVGANDAIYHDSNDAPKDPDFANMTSVSSSGYKGTSFAAPRAASIISKIVNQKGLNAKQALQAAKIAVSLNSKNELIEEEAQKIADLIKSGTRDLGIYTGDTYTISESMEWYDGGGICKKTSIMGMNMTVVLDGSYIGAMIVPTHFTFKVSGPCTCKNYVICIIENDQIFKGTLTVSNSTITGSAETTFYIDGGSFPATANFTGNLNSNGVITGSLSISSVALNQVALVTLRKQ